MRVVLPAFALVFGASTVAAAPLPCENARVTVSGGTAALRSQTCAAADRAIALFAECDLALEAPVAVSLRAAIDVGCLGLFHCGEARIDLLTPDAIASIRNVDSIFAHVPEDRFFASLVVHELAHALYDATECPLGNCMATAEYLAYSYQIASLGPEDRAPFMSDEILTKPIRRDYINPFMVLMSPDVFALSAWAHLNQRGDQCAWRQGIMSGVILFDHEPP